MYDNFEDVSIKDIINILIKRREIIAIVTLGVLLLGLVHSFLLTKPQYTSSLSLEVSRLEPAVVSPEDSSRVYKLLESISDSSNMEFEDYVSAITSDEVLEETIKDLKLEDTYTASSLRSAIAISSDPETKTIDIQVTAKDSKRSGQILASLSKNLVDHITSISQESSSRLLEVIENQMEIEKEKYSKALEEYGASTQGIKTAVEIELEIEGMYQQLTQYKLDLNDLEIKKDGINAGLAKANSSPAGAMTVRPSSNSSNIYLDTGRGTLELDLAETEAKISSTQASIKNIQESIEGLKRDYQDTEFTENVILKKVELAKESYEVFAMKHQELSMQSSMDIGGISINPLAETLTENKPAGSRKIIKLTIFTILGFMSGIILSFVLEYIEHRKKKQIKR